MPITVTCNCGKQFQTRDENAGRRARCPDCGRELIIPSAEGAPAPAPELELAPLHEGPPRTSGKAIASLVLGIPSALPVCIFLTGIPAIILGVLGIQEIDRSRGALKGKGMATAGIVLGGIGTTMVPIVAVFVALLLPAVQAAREAARRAQCTNNLKQIALAMYNYHSSYGAFPPAATVDPSGKPLLSWRVLLLPFLEAEPLYREFHLDEPWDSPHNKPLLEKMPTSFQCPSLAASVPGTTGYQVLIGPGTIFESGQTVSLKDIPDGAASTLLIVESKSPTPWTQPSGLPFTPGRPIEGQGSMHPGGLNAAFADGSVRFVKNTASSRTLEALATRNGGEVVAPGGD